MGTQQLAHASAAKKLASAAVVRKQLSVKIVSDLL